MSAGPHDNAAGVRAAVVSTTGVGSILIGIASFIPGDAGKIFSILVPLISSALSWGGILLYNMFIEPQEVVAWRYALKKDLKEQLAIINDNNCDEDTKAEARAMYSKTKLKLATLRQDYASGTLNIKAPE